MQRPTITKQKDILNTQENVEENQSKESSSLVEHHRIENTPFTTVRHNDDWFIVMGDWRITHKYKTREEAESKLESEKWLIIMHMAIIAVEATKNKTIEVTTEHIYQDLSNNY